MPVNLSRRRLLGLVLCLGFAGQDAAADKAGRERQRKACAKLARRMRRLQSRLRAGHSNRQGRRYREQLRDLQLERYRRCR